MADDDAWERDRVEDEASRMDDPDEHPVRRYWAAKDRCHIEARHTFVLRRVVDKQGDVLEEEETRTASAADYLDETKKPERWFIRRVDELDYLRQVMPHVRRDNLELGFDAAVRLALVKCEGGPRLDCNPPGEAPTDNDIRTVVREGIIGQLGWAIVGMSRPLTLAEKKRSASSPGPTPPA